MDKIFVVYETFIKVYTQSAEEIYKIDIDSPIKIWGNNL